MPRPQRLIAAAVLLSLSAVLTGCGGGMSGFDPTDLLDFLDTKKKLPGDRKPVFPEGVPGLQPGVPKDLYKGAAVEPEPAATPSPAPEPAGKRGTKSRAKARNAAPAQTQAAPEVADPDVNVEDGSTAAAPPAPAPKRVVRRRTTAPPPDAAPAQQPASASPFPAPMPSNTFSR